MRRAVLFLAVILSAAPAGADDWTHAERVETYAVSGDTGIALYRSIGENGPKAGVGRAIAVTTYDLKWSRDYQPEAGGCRLRSARPNLTVIYRLPKAPKDLPPATQALWDAFIAGIAAHERVHGEMILELVKAAEAASTGFFVAGDPRCRRIDRELAARLRPLVAAHREKNRDFDRAEMSDGGNVHRLVLALVNGDR